jgi:hypothetical protein
LRPPKLVIYVEAWLGAPSINDPREAEDACWIEKMIVVSRLRC